MSIRPAQQQGCSGATRVAKTSRSEVDLPTAKTRASSTTCWCNWQGIVKTNWLMRTVSKLPDRGGSMHQDFCAGRPLCALKTGDVTMHWADYWAHNVTRILHSTVVLVEETKLCHKSISILDFWKHILRHDTNWSGGRGNDTVTSNRWDDRGTSGLRVCSKRKDAPVDYILLQHLSYFRNENEFFPKIWRIEAIKLDTTLSSYLRSFWLQAVGWLWVEARFTVFKFAWEAVVWFPKVPRNIAAPQLDLQSVMEINELHCAARNSQSRYAWVRGTCVRAPLKHFENRCVWSYKQGRNHLWHSLWVHCLLLHHFLTSNNSTTTTQSFMKLRKPPTQTEVVKTIVSGRDSHSWPIRNRFGQIMVIL